MTNNNAIVSNKIIGFIASLIVLTIAGYYFFIIKPENDLVKLNSDFRINLVKELQVANSLSDSIKVLSQTNHTINLPPLNTQLSEELKTYVSKTYKELSFLKADKDAWQQAVSTDNINSYRKYIKEQASGKHIAAAMEQIEFLEQEKLRLAKILERPKPLRVVNKNPFASASFTPNYSVSKSSLEDRSESTPRTLVQNAAPFIFDCCSSYIYNKKVNYIGHRELPNGRWEIEMYVQWTSSTTECVVKIYGELTVSKNGCNPKWKFTNSQKPLTCFIKPGCRYICESYFDECL